MLTDIKVKIDKIFRFVYYQDKHFYYFWKPAGLASTRWKSVSFLDFMENEEYNWEILKIFESQKAFFGREKEYWLLNRLDWSTTWLLYFAKNLKVYNKFRELQKEEKINKYYVAEVFWNIQNWTSINWYEINYPIMHHKFSEDRMIVIKTESDSKNWKWKVHFVKTTICDIDYDIKNNRSVVLVKIHKGIRHQIRIHLASIWFPICWDNIYCKSKKDKFNKLQLFSVWMDINDCLL